MRRLKPWLIVGGLSLPGVWSSPAVAAEGVKVSLGIFPTQDTSGESQGITLARALPNMIFERLKASQVQPVFLAPGRAYSPLEEEAYLEYARAAEVNAVLVTRLVSRARRTGLLEVESYVVNLTGARSPALVVSEPIDKRDLLKALTYDGARFFGQNREFEKQPLGKAAKKLATVIAGSAASQAAHLGEPGSAEVPAASAGTCDIKVRVRYMPKGASSKTYVLIVNGREESLGIVDGVVNVKLSSGPVVLHASVRDAPYKLPVQDSYSANTYLDCGRPERTLALEIGPVGEALLRWQP
jgi:hypothetical protein